MKTPLRILVLIISLIIAVISLLPPDKDDVEIAETSDPAHSERVSAAAAPNQTQKAIKDLLGGAALDSGKKAQEKISEVNKIRENEFEDVGL